MFSSRAGANNLIPMEIALKIAEKIRAHERFAAYIVIPMWPEGVPTGNAVQRILFWQVRSPDLFVRPWFSDWADRQTWELWMTLFSGSDQISGEKSSN